LGLVAVVIATFDVIVVIFLLSALGDKWGAGDATSTATLHGFLTFGFACRRN